MRPESRSALTKVVELAERLRERTASLSPAAYARDVDLQAIVERHLITIGEALGRVARKDSEVFAQLPEGREVVDFRNVLVHGYDVIDHEVVWTAVTEDLPELVAAARALLSEPRS